MCVEFCNESCDSSGADSAVVCPCVQSSPTDLVIQVVLIAESVRLQQTLATYGIQCQTPHQVEPIQIWPPMVLAKAYENLGVNAKLSLTGRPPRPIGGLGTAKVSHHKKLCQTVLLVVELCSDCCGESD